MKFNFTTERKIQIAPLLIGIRSLLYLLDSVMIFFSNGSYGNYGNQFIKFLIFAYLAYALQRSRHKNVRLLALIFTGIIILRLLFGSALILLAPSESSLLVMTIIHGLLFGIIPFMVLLQKDVRGLYTEQNNGFQK